MLNKIDNQKSYELIKKNLKEINNLIWSFKQLRQDTVEDLTFPINLSPKTIDADKLKMIRQKTLDFNHILGALASQIDKLIPFYEKYADEGTTLRLHLDAYKQVKKMTNRKKPLYLIGRHDFMFDEQIQSFQQIEYNLLSAAGGNTSKYLCQFIDEYYAKYRGIKLNRPQNSYHDLLKLASHQFLNNSYNPDAYFMIIHNEVPLGDMNYFEKEIDLMMKLGIKVLNIKCSELGQENYHVDEEGRFFYKKKEISVIHYRAFKSFVIYHEIKTPFLVAAESSKAIIIPSLEMGLVNNKINHLLFCNEDLRKKYGVTLPEEYLLKVKDIITPTYMLEEDFDGDRQKMLDFVNKDRDSYLIKTLLEGGMGDVLVDQEMVDFIKEGEEKLLRQYLLVRKAKVNMTPSYAIRKDELHYFEKSIPELGIYFTSIFKEENGEYKISRQHSDAYLVRTKPVGISKGGLSTGYSTMDTLIL